MQKLVARLEHGLSAFSIGGERIRPEVNQPSAIIVEAVFP